MLNAVELDRILLRNLREITLIADEIHALQEFDTGKRKGPYPHDLTREEFLEAAATNPDLTRSDTVVVKDVDHSLRAIPYTEAFRSQFQSIARCLKEASVNVEDPAFRQYLSAAENCMTDTSPSAYYEMMQKWLEAREHPVQLVFVWDETYSDTFLGVKGSVDAALFVADDALSEVVQHPVETWATFSETLRFPGNPHNFSGFYTRVYQTISLGGALPGMKLRAWNLPDDLEIRQKMGSHQLLLRENTLDTLENDLIPMIKRIFHLSHQTSEFPEFLQGLLWTLTAHELGHNLGCYDEQRNLMELNDTFEELKANIIPLIWIMAAMSRSLTVLPNLP